MIYIYSVRRRQGSYFTINFTDNLLILLSSLWNAPDINFERYIMLDNYNYIKSCVRAFCLYSYMSYSE